MGRESYEKDFMEFCKKQDRFYLQKLESKSKKMKPERDQVYHDGYEGFSSESEVEEDIVNENPGSNKMEIEEDTSEEIDEAPFAKQITQHAFI